MSASPSTPPTPPLYGIVIPVRNEEACLGPMLTELQAALPGADRFRIAIGLNGNQDRSGAIAASLGVLAGSTEAIGYGHGCLAAIAALRASHPPVDAYLFMAGDGANDPAEIPLLTARYEAGTPLVLGDRTLARQNWRRPWRRNLANLLLGTWAAVLTGHPFVDLGPFRIIDRALFDQLQPRETTFGWTIEAQILAARLRVPIATVPVSERPRLAGKQKISGVSIPQTIRIGLAIAAAGWRTARRPLPCAKAALLTCSTPLPPAR